MRIRLTFFIFRNAAALADTIRPYGGAPHPFVGVGVLDDPADHTNSIADPGRLRFALRVGGDDLGAPLSDACRIPARCGHRALQDRKSIQPCRSVCARQ